MFVVKGKQNYGNLRKQYIVTVIEVFAAMTGCLFRLTGTFRHREFMLIVYNCPVNCLSLHVILLLY